MSDRRQLVHEFVTTERQPPGLATMDMLTWSRHYGKSTTRIQRGNVTHTQELWTANEDRVVDF